MFRKFEFFPLFCLGLALIVFSLSERTLSARIWTDRQGRQTEAQFVRIKGENVVLQKGLKPIVIPFKEFCDEDQDYIKEQTKSKGGDKNSTVKSGDFDSTEDSPALPAALKPKKTKTQEAEEDNPFEAYEDKSVKDKSSGKEVQKAKEERKEKPEKTDSGKEPFNGEFGERAWKDKKGTGITAKFVRLEGKTVILSKDGQEQEYPLDEFCYQDKLYIRQAAYDQKKYQKFLANQENGDVSGGTTAHASPAPSAAVQISPMPTIPSPMPNIPNHTINPAFEAMRQNAQANRQQIEEQQRQLLAQIEQRRQQAEAQRQQNELNRQAEVQRQIAQHQNMNGFEQQMQDNTDRMHHFPGPPSMPVPQSVRDYNNYDDAQATSFLIGFIIGRIIVVLIILTVVGGGIVWLISLITKKSEDY